MYRTSSGRSRRLLQRLTTTLLLLWAVPAAAAQTWTGTVLGTMRDQTDSVVPGATVLIVHVETGLERRVFSDARGDYEAPVLPPGEYRIEVQQAGFRTTVRTGVHLPVNGRIRIDHVLEVGSFDEEVIVRADAPVIQGETAAVGTVVDHIKIVELPLNGRDFFQLSSLVPGALPAAEGSQNSSQGGAISVNGAREQSNNFLLDGIDNNDLAINQMVIPPSADAVQEFKVQSSTYAAEFGRSAGGQFSFVTRSGGNQLAGSAYEFLRNAALDARNYFDLRDREIPQFQRNLFGGTIGGPLRRDKLFFFGNYEGTRVRQAVTRIATVPPVAWIQGDFSSLLTGVIDPRTGFDVGQLFDPRTGLPVPGNRIPAPEVDPAGAAVARFYPPPDDRDAREPAPATVAPKSRADVNQLTMKIDQNAGPSRFLYRYSVWNENRFDPFDRLSDPTNVPGFGSFTRNRGQSLAFGWTRTIGSAAVSDFRFGFNRLRSGIFQEHQGNDVSRALGIEGLLTEPGKVGRPGVVLGITSALHEPINLPQERRDNTFHFVHALAWLRGPHSFKAGADIRVFHLNFFADIFARGQFIFVGLSGNPVADLLMGTPLIALRQNPEADSITNLRTMAVNWYLQDDWKVTDRLTLNLGLRYEYNRPPTDTQDRFSVPDLANPNGGFLRVGEGGLPRAGYPPDRNNFAPRLGVAWRPAASQALVVRGGYGLYYDVGIANLHIAPRFNPPQFALDLFVGPLSLRTPFAGAAVPVPNAAGIDAGYRDPRYHHWSLGLQRELLPDLGLEVGYVGSKGVNLIRRVDVNQGPAGGPPFRNPNFASADFVQSTAASTFHSLQVRVERRFVGGFTMLSAYTWSRSRDHASSLFGSRASGGINAGLPQNSFDPDAEWGPSDFDTPHRYVLSGVWALPVGAGRRILDRPGVARAVLGGWQVAGIATFQSGRPFTVYYGPSANFSGTSNGANGGPGLDRPDQIGDPRVPSPGPDRWFDPSAFASPNRTFGNVGRNTLRGDGLSQVDLALYKNIALASGPHVQVRVEMFNAFNTPFFFLPVADLTSADAGRIVQAGDARQIQLGLKLRF